MPNGFGTVDIGQVPLGQPQQQAGGFGTQKLTEDQLRQRSLQAIQQGADPSRVLKISQQIRDFGVVQEIQQPRTFEDLPAERQKQINLIDNVNAQLDNYKNLYTKATKKGGPLQLTGKDAAELRAAYSNLLFSVATASGTGALQAADRKIVEQIIPDPTNIFAAGGILARGGRKGVLASLEQSKNIFDASKKIIETGERQVIADGQQQMQMQQEAEVPSFQGLTQWIQQNPNDPQAQAASQMIQTGQLTADNFGAFVQGQQTAQTGTPPETGVTPAASPTGAVADPVTPEQAQMAAQQAGITPQQAGITPQQEGGLIRDIAGRVMKSTEETGELLGGAKIGEAIGEAVGGEIGQAQQREQFANLVTQYDQMLQQGTITQQQRDQAVANLAQTFEGIAGTDVTPLQVAGDVGKIATTFVGGPVLKGGLGVLKTAGLGAAALASEGLAEGETDVRQEALAGGAIGTGFGVGGKLTGKLASKAFSKIEEKAKLKGRAQKLAAEILQPTKKETEQALLKGRVPKAVTALVDNVKKSKDFNELRNNLKGTTDTLFKKRDQLIKQNNFDVTDEYLTPLRTRISEMEAKGIAKPSEINAMRTRLQQEEEFIQSIGGKISRVEAQARKEALQDATQPLLKKKEAGTLSREEASDKVAMDAIRFGLKEAVVGDDLAVKSINDQYSGLKRAQELLAGQEALALKASEIPMYKKIVPAIVDGFTGGIGVGSAAFVRRQAAKKQSDLTKLTKRLEKLSKSQGGVFTNLYRGIKNIKESALFDETGQGRIGDMVDDFGDFLRIGPKKIKGETPTKLNNIDEMLKVAPKASDEAKSFADSIAKKYGGSVTVGPIKTRESAMRKIEGEYGGDATRIKDLARNTIIVDKKNIEKVYSDLKKGADDAKLVLHETDPFGYSGINSKIKTKSDIWAEVQANSPEMIFAKETEKNSKAILGEKLFNEIKSKYKVEGGKGHIFYEKGRVLKPGPELEKIKKESREYYKKFLNGKPDLESQSDALKKAMNG